MRDDDSKKWFPKRDDELPSPEDLTPLSQSLISPPLALAFNIRAPSIHHHPSSAELDSSSGDPDEPARTLKRPRLVWTPQLHKRFVDAVAQLGIKNAVPKTIMQMMSVDGLTRENVASHLQKYRLYLKRMQGNAKSGGGGEAAADRLFASTPVPAHFLHTPPEVSAMAALHHRQQVAVMVAGGGYPHHHQMGQFGAAAGGGGGGWRFETRGVEMGGGYGMMHRSSGEGYGEDGGCGGSGNGRRVLTLFPTTSSG